MLIKLSITIEVEAEFHKDTGEFPDGLVRDLDVLLGKIKDICSTASVTDSIYDRTWEEV